MYFYHSINSSVNALDSVLNSPLSIGIFRKSPWFSPIMARQSWPRSPLTQSLIVAITLLQQIHAQGYAEECFPDYGSCSQQVIVPLYIAAGCACPGPSGCACLNDTYLFNVMMDVGACCSLVEVNNTAQTSADNCNTDGTPMLVSVAELIDTGKAGASSSCPIAALATLESSSASTQSSSTSTQFPSSTTTTPTQSKGSNQGSSETSTCEYSFRHQQTNEVTKKALKQQAPQLQPRRASRLPQVPLSPVLPKVKRSG